MKGSLLYFSETHLHTQTSGYMSSNALAVSLHYELSQLWLGHLRLEVAIGVLHITYFCGLGLLKSHSCCLSCCFHNDVMKSMKY